MPSRLAIDGLGRRIAVAQDGKVYLVVDDEHVGFEPPGRKPTLKERRSACAPYESMTQARRRELREARREQREPLPPARFR